GATNNLLLIITGRKAGGLRAPKRSLPRLAPRLLHDPDIGPRRFPTLGIDFLRFLVGHRAGDDHVVASFPVDRRRDAMLRGKLHRVDYTQNLIEIAPRGHGIDQDELDLLIWANDEHVADGLVVGGRPPLRGAYRARRQHTVELGDLEVGIADHRVIGGEA